jgi:class 3 adenylate cyclase
MLQQNMLMFLDIDVRPVLPTIDVPTIVLHRRGDMTVNRRAAEWMAGQIPGATYVELSGTDHLPFAGDSDALLDEIEEFLTGARRTAEIDRVLATVMFTDIVDSTKRASVMGDRPWRDLLDAQNVVLRRELERFQGREIKTLGDGMLATFDGPARAIRCAREMTEAFKSLGIEIRVGLHTGEVELVGDPDAGSDVAGIAVHIAARVGALAGSSEVLVSGTVKDLVAGSGIAFADRGEHVLKGIPDQWRLFALQP